MLLSYDLYLRREQPFFVSYIDFTSIRCPSYNREFLENVYYWLIVTLGRDENRDKSRKALSRARLTDRVGFLGMVHFHSSSETHLRLILTNTYTTHVEAVSSTCTRFS